MHRRTHDIWDPVLTHNKNRISPRQQQVVERLDDESKHAWFNAFGTDIVEFGERKVWRLRVTPYFGNMLIGIVEHSAAHCGKYAAYNDKNGRDFSFRAGGIGYMPICGKLFWRHNQILLTKTKYDYLPKNGAFVVDVVLDMTALDVRLAFEVDGRRGAEITFNREIVTAHNQYRLAVAMHEAQRVEILHHDEY